MKTGARILIVDDSAEVVEVLVDGLRHYGHVVEGASTARDALRLVAELRPEIVICDLSLTEIDGWTLAAKIRELYTDAPPRLLALSGYDDEDDRERSRVAGFEQHLIKPVRIAQLDAILRRAP